MQGFDSPFTSMIERLVKMGYFRNANHATWFVLSLWILVLTLAYFVYPNHRVVVLFPIGIYLTAMIQAIVNTYVTKTKSETLSKDCIWFNGLLLIVYLVVFLKF